MLRRTRGARYPTGSVRIARSSTRRRSDRWERVSGASLQSGASGDRLPNPELTNLDV